MTETALAAAVGSHRRWLSQGDIFKRLLIPNVGVRDGTPTAELDQVPVMLVSHGCAIDKKKGNGQSALEWLTFVPLQDVTALPRDRAGNLRASAGQDQPYAVMYLGDIPEVGESYAVLNRPYTLPASLLAPSLKDFTAEETGEGEDRRIVNGAWTTRVACLTPLGITLLQRKWSAHWTGTLPPVEDGTAPPDP